MQYSIIKSYPLRERMRLKGLTIRKLSVLSGVHYTYISRLLSGKSVGSENIMTKLKNVL